MNKQMEIIQALHVKSEINTKEEIRNWIDFLKAYCLNSGAKGFVLGISGGPRLDACRAAVAIGF